LDHKLQAENRCQTNGILTGPATSNLVAEILLQDIDSELSKLSKISHFRWIDDYTVFAEDSAQLEDFKRTLEVQLSRFDLKLNSKKTKINSLQNYQSDMPVDLELALIDFDFSPRKLELLWMKATSYLNTSYDQRVLRRVLSGTLDKAFSVDPLYASKMIVRFAMQFPYLAPNLKRVIFNPEFSLPLEEAAALNDFLRSHARELYDDSTLWFLAAANQNSSVPQEVVEVLLENPSPLVLAFLYETGSISGFCASALIQERRSEVYGDDKWWLPAYQLFASGEFTPYDVEFFQQLKSKKVDFVIDNWKNKY
jgi:hypothetical protein